MNIKHYIDYFSDIKALPRDEQFTLLTQAKDDIIKGAMINPFTLSAAAFRIVFILLFNLVGYFFWGYSIAIIIGALVLGLLCSRVAINERNDAMMLNALTRVLAEKNTKHS